MFQGKWCSRFMNYNSSTFEQIWDSYSIGPFLDNHQVWQLKKVLQLPDQKPQTIPVETTNEVQQRNESEQMVFQRNMNAIEN